MTVSTSTSAGFESSMSESGELTLRFWGRLEFGSVSGLWTRMVEAIDRSRPTCVTIDASEVEYCDGAGLGLFVEAHRRGVRACGQVRVQGLSEELQRLLDQFELRDFEDWRAPPPSCKPLAEEVGESTYSVYQDTKALIAFVGEMTVALLQVAVRPRSLRWGNAMLAAEKAGVNALPIVMLIGFLIGLIIAFQAATPMQQFGAEFFVTDIVALSMLRELGPVMTAIVLAGRSGSAFAAEIGTMKVREEIDALVTMGIDPVKMLATPRVLGAMFMTPLLSAFASLAGLIGGGIVVLSLGFSLHSYTNRITDAVDYVDLLSGLFKAFVFAILVAGVGCLRGLRTNTGPSAVGDSTTSAVVSGIILIIITDAILSVSYYYLGI